ncbi:MAG: phospholipase D family protein, partial [Pseudomonadota bacterium]|nr:phospholipase D family protein [Pseudomonadota bacterium]
MKSKLGRGLPSPAGRSESAALSDTAGTVLGAAVMRLLQARPPGDTASGVYPLREPHAAFAARMLLVREAECSLDLQYYIWHGDLTGTLLFKALHEAAERGVRVRLLLDDHNTQGLDPALSSLDLHPHIEVRLFNPYTLRKLRWLNGLIDFTRLNHRMHNKSFTIDNQATIVGGRNIGDEYFGAGDALLFNDLDVLAVGPVARAVSADFDRYWNCASAVPVARLLSPATPAQLADLLARAADVETSPRAAAYVQAVRESEFVDELRQGTIDLQWVPTELISDDPAKALGQAQPDTMFPARLVAALGRPQHELDLVSAYFVPGKQGVADLAGLARDGVAIRVLTNALESTDVAVVHAGYAKRRRALLRAGIALYELQRQAAPPRRNRSVAAEGIAGKPKKHLGGSGVGGSSAASLHAKTFAVDRDRIFVGSFNFDPR